ncbi:aminoglycoside phosphotransferase family protein [Fusibacter ferrireducens]|uniref:Aminoglycoside phosphotransferase family protein n=1 Tax=Fusibacter ferrireducens TaxID=2785058 RepID=A0ABR9ZWB9_9FIRM|nr:aminoglycoside phosphotransferase family protein [Fusibacter ferrireducens]MBF4694768.1 aminoglycoside phosphotransferase family protein [Fusibacter ferrireducens]
MNVTYDDIGQIFKEKLYQPKVNILPCGNHNLNRNLVFKVYTSTAQWIIKFYYKPLKRTREINALSFFKQAHLEIIDQGILDNGIEWLVYNFVEGQLLEQCYESISEANLNTLFFDMGREMARLHNVELFDYFGDWVPQKQSALEHYKDFIINDTERLILNNLHHNQDQNHILNAAIDLLRNEYKHIRQLNVGRLCHRDFDGRNIIVSFSNETYKLDTILDFEKCVVFNEYFDIIGLYRKYFLNAPQLIKPFKMGYEDILKIDSSFNEELKFNLLRLGIDLSSWAKYVSNDFYVETINYLSDLLSKIDQIEQYYL